MPVAGTCGKGPGIAGDMFTDHAHHGRAACGGLMAPMQRWWCWFWPVKGLLVVPSSSVRWFSSLGPLPTLNAKGGTQEPHGDLCGGWCLAALGWFWNNVSGGGFPAQGASVRATTASPGARRVGASPLCSCFCLFWTRRAEMSVLRAACEVSGITARSLVQGDAPRGWGSSLVGRREPVWRWVAGAGRPWGPGPSLRVATLMLWHPTKPRRFSSTCTVF